MIPTQQEFAALCYLVLMDHHGDGWQMSHPNYMEKKLELLERGYEAYGALDRPNQNKVKNHLEVWGYQLPEVVATYESEVEKVFNETIYG